MKLATAQMALGVLILAVVLTCPAFLFVVAVPGLAVFGCGVAQFLKARGRAMGLENMPDISEHSST